MRKEGRPGEGCPGRGNCTCKTLEQECGWIQVRGGWRKWSQFFPAIVWSNRAHQRDCRQAQNVPACLKFKVQGLCTESHLHKLHQPQPRALKARCATISWSHLTNSDAVTRHVFAQAGDDFLSADSSQGLSASRFQAPGDVGHRGSGGEWNRSRARQVTWSARISKSPLFRPCVKTHSLKAASRVRWFINFQTLGKRTYCLDFFLKYVLLTPTEVAITQGDKLGWR